MSRPAEPAGAYVSEGGALCLTNLGQLELLRGLTARGAAMRTIVRGFSMSPFIRDGDTLTIAPTGKGRLRTGDILAFVRPDTGRLMVHRMVSVAAGGLIFRGDNSRAEDGIVRREHVLGRVISIERKGRRVRLGLGVSGFWIARLSRTGMLTRLASLAGLVLRTAHFGLRGIQSIAPYRALGKRLGKKVFIVRPEIGDLEAVHRHFHPSSLHRPRSSPRPEAVDWVAKRGDKIVGYGQYVHHSGPGSPWAGHWLFSLEVWGRYRGWGIGEALARRVIKTAAERGAPELRLAVDRNNHRAVKLYRKLGFEPFAQPDLEKEFEREMRRSGRRRISMKKTITESPKAIEIQHFGLWNKIKEKRIPLSFEWEATARCNNDCRHCFINRPAGDERAKAAELTAGEILDIAGQAVDLGTIWVLITGGEPLLREDFKEVYLGLKRLGLLVSVFTNATLIRDEHIALFREYPPRDIEVTVYGVTRATYEAVTRRPGSFRAFTRGLNGLLESGVRIRLKSMTLRSNLHEHEEIAAFCRARTKDYYRFDPQLHLRFDGDPARNDEIRDERLTPAQIVDLERSDDQRLGAMRKNCETLINESFRDFDCDHLFPCGAGNGSFSIGFDGTFRLCPSLWAEGMTYDLRKGTLAEAWNEFVPKIRSLRAGKGTPIESCRKCPLVNLCLWCPAHAHLETGRMEGPTPYFCGVAHARAAVIRS